MVSIKLTLSFLMYFINPLLGFFITLSFINKEKKIPALFISFFFFIVFLYIPPLGDLYRHNITYELINSNLINGKLDYIFYYNLLLFKNIGIPFYFIPPIYVFLSTYLYLKSFALFYKSSISPPYLLVLIVILLFSINYISIGSGLRYGLASAIVLFAYSYNFISNKMILPFILIVLSAQIHFSVYLFLLPLLLSKIKLNSRVFYVLCIVCFLLSQITIPLASIVTEKLNYGTSYISGQWSTSENNNLAGKVRFILNQIPFYLYFFIFFFITKNNYKSNSAILYWVILLCLSLSFSVTLLVRYSLIPTFLLLFLILIKNNKSILLQAFLLTFSILYFSIDTLYGYRRQIELGSMWEALYIPPLVKVFTLSDDYQSMVSEIDSDGFWIHNKINLD